MNHEEDLLEEMVVMDAASIPLQADKHLCPKCNRSFTLASNLTRHMRHNKICGESKGFECSNCHKIFSLNATMKDHYQRCIAEDPYRFSCPNCTKQFTFKSSLNKHLRGRCRTLKKKKTYAPKVKIYSCKHCAADFYDNYVCQKHEATCTSETEYLFHICPQCGKPFTMKSSLNKHLRDRCKFAKYEDVFVDEEESETRFVSEDATDSNDAAHMGEVEVYEAWFETEDIVEECPEGTCEIITDDVETYVEISNEPAESDEKTTEFATKNEEDSNELPATITIENE